MGKIPNDYGQHQNLDYVVIAQLLKDYRPGFAIKSLVIKFSASPVGKVEL
jgi:hypothetical protein